jgi:hypothetical protein
MPSPVTRKCKFKRRTECMVAVVANHSSPADPCCKTPDRPCTATPGTIDGSDRDSCAAGRARDAETDAVI